jgi:hypothetical protein
MLLVLMSPSPQKPADCPVCHKTVSRKADLPRHMRTHDLNKEALYVLVPSQIKHLLIDLLSSLECTHALSPTAVTRPSRSPTCRRTSGRTPASAPRSALSLTARSRQVTQAASRVTASKCMATCPKHAAPTVAELLGNLLPPHTPLLNL